MTITSKISVRNGILFLIYQKNFFNLEKKNSIKKKKENILTKKSVYFFTSILGLSLTNKHPNVVIKDYYK